MLNKILQVLKKGGNEMDTHGKEPKGTELLATLINLLAEQEGVKITFELEEGAA